MSLLLVLEACPPPPDDNDDGPTPDGLMVESAFLMSRTTLKEVGPMGLFTAKMPSQAECNGLPKEGALARLTN